MSQTNPVKAIKDFCFDCCGQSRKEVELCPSTKCALYAFRLGKNPYHKKELSEEQRAALQERMKKVQEARKAKAEVE